MQHSEAIASSSGTRRLRKFDDCWIGLRQRRLAQVELWREGLNRSGDKPGGVLCIDFAIDLDAQFAEGSIGRERTNG